MQAVEAEHVVVDRQHLDRGEAGVGGVTLQRTAAGHVAAGVNLVEMVATAPTARGRGYGAAVTWAASTVDPALPAVLIASDPGRPVYERLGFLPVSRWTFWHRPAGERSRIMSGG